MTQSTVDSPSEGAPLLGPHLFRPAARHESGGLPTLTVRELIGELALIEDAMRAVHDADRSSGSPSQPSHDAVSLLTWQRLVVSELRRRHSQWRATAATAS